MGQQAKKLNKIQLIQESLEYGKLGPEGQLCVYTGTHTGRSAKDKYIVDLPELNDIQFGEAGMPISRDKFAKLFKFFLLNQKDIYVKDFVSGIVRVRLITDRPSHAVFVSNMFKETGEHSSPDLTIYALTNLEIPSSFGLRSSTAIAMDLVNGCVLIAGTKYAGEVKKSVFTYLSYKFPEQDVLPMHSSVTTDDNGQNSAVFFGLSGTGKTTLSADPSRKLVGDDEHGWGNSGLFNFEAGCYAKLIRLSKKNEPMIWNATHEFGAMLENVSMDDDSNLDFDSSEYTENTRGAYPLTAIPNAHKAGFMAAHPNNIIMLTCDAYGVLPSVSKLTPRGAAYHFMSGYTAKVAGTERGVTEPQATFSALFGAPFMPKKISIYTDMLMDKIEKYNPNVWLVNTGWFGGGPDVEKRIDLPTTRMIVNDIIEGKMKDRKFVKNQTFNLYVPQDVPFVSPEQYWENKDEYNKTAQVLIKKFNENIDKFDIDKAIIEAGMPR